MDIRIITLKIQNFKGIQDRTFNLGGVSANIVGDNGLGKSTIFDAFTWLLFGKDHRNTVQNKFEIVPIDPVTGEQVHHLETLVEAELSTDGIKTVLRRVWRETWSRAKKETESRLTGHESLFFVNGVNVDTLENYSKAIADLVDEKIFRLITDPLFFIGDTTDKKARRVNGPRRGRYRQNGNPRPVRRHYRQNERRGRVRIPPPDCGRQTPNQKGPRGM